MGDLEEKRKVMASRESNRPKTAVPTAETRKNNVKIVVPPPRKIVSAQARKRTEDMRRIEYENKILQSKISSFGAGSKSVPYGTTAVSKDEPQKSTPTKANNTPIESEETKTYNKLLQTFNNLKKEVSASEEENKSLKAKLGNYDIQIKKFQQQIERLKMMNETSGNPVSKASTKVLHQSKSVDDEKSAKMSGDGMDRSFTANEDTNGTGIAPAKDDDITAAQQQDAEYQHLKEEYDFLQRLRRSILERIERSTVHCQFLNTQQDTVQQQYDLLQQRLLAIQYGNTLNTIIAPSKRSQQPIPISESKDEKKGEAKGIPTATPSSSSSSSATALEEDNILFHRYLSLENEFAEVKETETENAASMVVLSNRMEYDRLYQLLQEKGQRLQEEIAVLKKKNQQWFQQTNNNEIEGLAQEIVGRRHMLTFLKSVAVQVHTEAEWKERRRQMTANEKDFNRLVIKRKERELMKEHNQT